MGNTEHEWLSTGSFLLLLNYILNFEIVSLVISKMFFDKYQITKIMSWTLILTGRESRLILSN